MNILIVAQGKIPVCKYGGTERVLSSLCSALNDQKHNVSLLAPEGSSLPFSNGRVYNFDPNAPLAPQIPSSIDCVHLNCNHIGDISIPYIVTIHGNPEFGEKLDLNSVFVSQNHAFRHNSTSWIHNGLDWREYGDVDLTLKRRYFHFLAKAAWRVKNLQGAIDITNKNSHKLEVLGGSRLNIKMGFRLTLSQHVHFNGMVDEKKKSIILPRSKGLIFPVRWHEPFGLALIESLYFGCPVFGTPYGSLPEIVGEQYGFLSSSKRKLAQYINDHRYNPNECHEYALNNFDSKTMASRYTTLYERVISGEHLNQTIPTLKDVPSDKFLPWLE
ncbi:MAG: glycosyltransferase [Rikenellaceae bacterium]